MSSLKDLASLIMVPSLVKDGRLDTVKPLGNSIIHPDATGNNDGTDGSTPAEGNFTFSRGSNLAATRVDVNGLIEKGRENLLTYSNEFDNTSGWTQYSGYTLTSGQTDKDGGTNAWKWESTQSGTAQINNVHNQTGMLTHSIYAKAGNFDVLKIWIGVTAEFNLSTGVVSHSKSKMTDVGNGWWRCEIFSPYTRFNPFFAPTASGQYLYIQDAQAEQGLVATDYIETGASTAQGGILEDLPRLDYSGGASCPALLLEPQRTNMNPNGEYFEAWNRVNTNVGILTPNTYTSPEGVPNAYQLEFTQGGSNSQIYKVLNGLTIGTKYTSSIYVKYISGSGENFQILKSFGTAGVRCTFTNNGADLDVIAVAGTQANDFGKEYVGDGWFRIWFTFASDTTNWEINISRFDGSSSDVYGIYGFQLEQGSYPTSYIPTYGSAVTRSLDVSSLGGLQTSSILNGTTGTFLFEGIKNRDWYFTNFVITTDGSNTNKSLLIDNSGSAIRLRAWNASSNQDAIVTTSAVSNGTFKYLIRWDNGDLKVFINGVSAGTASINAYSYTTLNLKEGTWSNNLLKQLLVFPTALTDSECIALTTI